MFMAGVLCTVCDAQVYFDFDMSSQDWEFFHKRYIQKQFQLMN